VSDISPDVRIARIAGVQKGRIDIAGLRACGLDDDAVARRVRSGRLHRVHHGVYAVGHVDDTLEGRLMAAVLAGGRDASISGWATLALYALVRWDDRDVDVSVPAHGGGRRRDGIRFHRVTLHARDTTRHRGIRTVTVARALLDVAPQLGDRRLTRLVRKAQMERVANVRQIAEVVRGARGRPGSRRLAAVIATGPAPTASTDEDVVLDLVLDAGFEHPDVNVALALDAATRYVPDLRWPAARLIVEIDSAWHDGRAERALDAERQAALEAAGERVLRTTREQAVLRPRQLVQRLVAAGAPRRR
jgi:predicted transcriptional regulator of viral defense system